MREVVAGLQGSRIREVANEGIGREGVLAFWFGESDEVTPEPIRAAAIASLQAGETFYAHNLGLPELRQAIAGYTERLHPGRGATHWFERIAVTSGGVNGLMLAAQTLVNAGDEVVLLTPAWPNLVAQPQIMGARVRTVSLVPRAGARLRAARRAEGADPERRDAARGLGPPAAVRRHRRIQPARRGAGRSP